MFSLSLSSYTMAMRRFRSPLPKNYYLVTLGQKRSHLHQIDKGESMRMRQRKQIVSLVLNLQWNHQRDKDEKNNKKNTLGQIGKKLTLFLQVFGFIVWFNG